MPYIKRDFIEKIEEESDLVQIIQEFVQLKKTGANYKGLSPFSSENTPSFTVSPAKSLWKDFSTGKGGSSPVSFIMEKTGCTFPEAIEYIAKKLGYEVEYEDSKAAEAYLKKQEKKQELTPLLQAAINKYHELFFKLPEDHPAKKEIYDRRKYDDATVKKYKIGYAPGNNFLYNLCVEKGIKAEALEIGLISDRGDVYYDRVIYPILEKKGARLYPVGLAGRTLSPDKKQAKWINSKDSILYNKETVWYGMDVARDAIAKKSEAWIVAGYNDVIAWQNNNLLNTVAGCGTAISEKQVKILKKLCSKVIFCMDPDKAGKASVLKYIPVFLAEGFRVELLELPGLDPDDFVRLYAKTVEKETLSPLDDETLRTDGFKYLLDNYIAGSKVSKARGAKKLVETVAKIEDEAMRSIYTEWLAKESGVKIADIKAWIKKELLDNKVEIKAKDGRVDFTDLEMYIIPAEVKTPLEKLLPTIKKYQLFMAANQIWCQSKDGPPYYFHSVSNFSIDIIQHMQDEKFPLKLLRIKNIHGHEKIFDCPSEAINTPMAFDNAVTAHGNFLWTGGRQDHQKLRAYLFDGMGTGRKIDVLGWQPEGFWCWNNGVTFPERETQEVNENGVFEEGGVSYYVPSANEIYKRNAFKYDAQKKVVIIEPAVSFQNYAAQMLLVHRNHAITAVLFSIASAFQDIVVKELGNFPMLFLYGPASSGKDQLAECCQSFFGYPQTAINLEGGVSTIKAQVREFAQFSNMISHLSEYKTGDSKLDGVLKGLWDRRGYKRGNIDSHVGTESIPILSSVIMTGNYTPDAEALITRLLWEEMSQSLFNEDEVREFDKLADMTKHGISGFTNLILKQRKTVELNFLHKFRELKATLNERMPDAKSRMISNTAVLASFYQLFDDVLSFPFSFADMLKHFQTGIDTQTRKLNSASTINRWWDCFLASMRGTTADQLRIGRDFKLEGYRMYFNFTNCYNKIQRQWWLQYHDTAPGKTIMMDTIRKDEAYIEDAKSVRMGIGKDSPNTSACIIDLNRIPVTEEIKHAVEFQLNENSLFDRSPVTPKDENDKEQYQEDLPF